MRYSLTVRNRKGRELRSGRLCHCMGKWHQSTDGGQDLFAYSPGSERIVLGDVLPNTGNVLYCFRVKAKTPIHAHWGVRWLSRSSSRRRRDSKNSSPSTGFTLPLLMSS